MTQVTHSNFGTGTVIEQDAKTVTVDFNGIVKKMMTAFAKLTNEDGTPFGTQFVVKIKKIKKVNKANFMSDAEFAKSKYATMSKDDFIAEREQDAYNSISW